MKTELKTFFPYNLLSFSLVPPLVRPFTTGVVSMYISPTSPVSLPYISPTSPLYLPYISLISPYISPTSPRLRLGRKEGAYSHGRA